MFVLTAKISKPKLIAGAVALAAVVLLLVLLLRGGTDNPIDPSVRTPSGASNDERVAYLATYGWSVNAEPVKTQKVKVPEGSENRVFARYNELQISQGFDLTQYAGKEIQRFVYEILNYPDATAPVYATVLVYDGQIIGGDVTDSAPNGVIHGFKKPAKTPAVSQSTAPSETQEPTQPSSPSAS